MSPSGTAGGQQTTTVFTDTALVADKSEVVASAKTVDANLQNPWGIAVATGLPFWIADNNSNLATLYSGAGDVETQEVTGSPTTGIAIPASAAAVQANPTGQVYNGSGSFLIATSKGQESALFLFDGEGGTIAGWAMDSGSTAVTAYDDGIANGANHAVYKGLALGTVNGATFLYATDLHNNKVDVFDTSFAKPADMQGKFVDSAIPEGFVPFGISAIGNQLYVTYAKQDSAKHDEVAGAGLGYVDVFDLLRQSPESIRLDWRAQRALGDRRGAQRMGLARGRCAGRQLRRREDQYLQAQRNAIGDVGGAAQGQQWAILRLSGIVVIGVRQRGFRQAADDSFLHGGIRHSNGRGIGVDHPVDQHDGDRRRRVFSLR